MKEKIQDYWRKIGHMQGVVIFMFILLASNFIWKLFVSGDDGNNQVLLFDTFDISGPFDFMVVHITNVVKVLVEGLGYDIHSHYSNDICFDNHNYILVIWGCTAIKQTFIFLSIMIFTQGPIKHKFWFVPIGLAIVYVFNISRIFVLTLVIESHPEMFDSLHEIIKYMFYGVIFLYWMIWEEKINLRRKKIAV